MRNARSEAKNLWKGIDDGHKSVEEKDIELYGAHNWALIQARLALPTVTAAPHNYVAPLTMTKPFPPALALCPIAIALPTTMFPI